ncbi:hypothetical protein FY034_17605 (plasmid) [Trichlorobacter lovleyi]|uniref:hypothetical protein n=1 Tax=Trichlorobacter lovleyi TaxID=313985 RepID=UPI0022407ECA|nr:hypothetical protein [Trichlorobacter lovleyi]QOX80840.1 hypothetical protein FY034_17605 [Trichlorobacter lovleyi]
MTRRESIRKEMTAVQNGRVLAMPTAGLSFADISLAAMDCGGNKTRTAKRLGVSIKGLEATIEREKLHHWFSGRSAPRPRSRCVSKSDVESLAQEGYTRNDTAYLLGISPAYLKSLIQLWNLADAFILRKGVAAAVTRNGYAWQAGR